MRLKSITRRTRIRNCDGTPDGGRRGSKPHGLSATARRRLLKFPEHWPVAYYRKLVERRIKMIEADPNIALIEKPEYKRRWNTEPWDEQLKSALRGWLLDRLENRRGTGPSWR